MSLVHHLLNKKAKHFFWINMKQAQIPTEEDIQIDLTFHGFSASLLKEFIQKIVKPHFEGNMNAAVRCLIQHAINEETIVNQTIIYEKTKR
jgi:hypothetical protein